MRRIISVAVGLVLAVSCSSAAATANGGVWGPDGVCEGYINQVSRFYSDHYYVSSTTSQWCNGGGYGVARDVSGKVKVTGIMHKGHWHRLKHVRFLSHSDVVAQDLTTRLWVRESSGYVKAAGIGQYFPGNGYEDRPASITCRTLAARWWHSESIMQFQTADQAANNPTAWYTRDPVNSDGLWHDCDII